MNKDLIYTAQDCKEAYKDHLTQQPWAKQLLTWLYQHASQGFNSVTIGYTRFKNNSRTYIRFNLGLSNNFDVLPEDVYNLLTTLGFYGDFGGLLGAVVDDGSITIKWLND